MGLSSLLCLILYGHKSVWEKGHICGYFQGKKQPNSHVLVETDNSYLMIGGTSKPMIICANGHSVCQQCSKNMKLCPQCRFLLHQLYKSTWNLHNIFLTLKNGCQNLMFKFFRSPCLERPIPNISLLKTLDNLVNLKDRIKNSLKKLPIKVQNNRNFQMNFNRSTTVKI